MTIAESLSGKQHLFMTVDYNPSTDEEDMRQSGIRQYLLMVTT